MEGWRFNPPRSWPVEPGHEPERGWRPPEEWGPLPPGHQLWLPEHPQPRRRGPALLALLAVGGLVAVAFAVPARADHRADRQADQQVRPIAWRADVAEPVIDVPAPAEVGVTPSPISKKRTRTHTVRRFATCAELRAEYPHGVGRRTAEDRSGGAEVTGFTKDAKVYAANKARDGDGDGIACER